MAVFEDPFPFDDKERLLEILEKYNVLQWKDNYMTADSATFNVGYGWIMLLQFEGGTMEMYQGSGPYKEEVVPETVDDLADEMENVGRNGVDSSLPSRPETGTRNLTPCPYCSTKLNVIQCD